MADDPAGDDPVAAYKQILRDCLDKRPSGTRLRIAEALGKHKSFVSQITNPAYAVPIPARHVNAILEICHFSPEERNAFLEAYVRAHPGRRQAVQSKPKGGAAHVLHIPVPAFDDPETQREVEETIRQLAARIIALAMRG